MRSVKKFFQGINIFPTNATTQVDSGGDLDVNTTDGKLTFFNGVQATASPVVTESQPATLTNKSMDGDFNTFTNLPGGSISGTIAPQNGGTGITNNSASTITISGNYPIDLTVTGATTATFQPTNGVLVGQSTTDTLTNKTLSGNTATNLVNGSGTFDFNSSGTISVPNATDTLVAKSTTDILSNKTLVSPTINTPNILTPTITSAAIVEQIATPTDPASGYDKLYFKSDDNLYSLTSAGVETQISNITSSSPSGSIMMYGGTSAPSGWLLCDGTSYLRTIYTALFSAIGTAYGTADGTHFSVPDMRGRFPRGVDNGAGNDPDTSSRTASATGGNTGDNPGSLQGNAFQTHHHSITDPGHTHTITQLIDTGSSAEPGLNFTGGTGVLQSNTFINAVATNTGISGTNDTSAAGATSQATLNETRPVNLYFWFIIKT
jgi:microcystin-dependent protein